MSVLDTKQINNLIQGNNMVAEIVSTSEARRAFVMVEAKNPNKFLNSTDIESMMFWLLKYEVDKAYIENDWYVSQKELQNTVQIDGITGIKELEEKLSRYLNDFKLLDVSWKSDSPI